MIIPPPKDELEIPYVDEIATFTKEQYEYIKERLSHPPWLCSSCGLNNHHYNQKCAGCKCEKR